MDTRYILLFIFILVLLYILHNTNQETYINVKIPKNILKYFSQNEFYKNTGDFKITYLEYEKNNLDAKSYIDSSINDFMKKTKNNSQNRYQIKQTFNNNELSNYILNNGYTPIVDFLKLNKKKVKPGFIRVSKAQWSFDYHYDCLDLLLIQLCGTRTIYTKKTEKGKATKHILKAGDTLFIPMGEYHKVKTDSDLNINFNIIFEQNDENRILRCKKKFGYDYKIQDAKCKTNNCI